VSAWLYSPLRSKPYSQRPLLFFASSEESGVTDTLQWRRKPGSLSPRTCAGFSSLPFVDSCLLNQLLPPVNAPSDRADPGKCQQRALCGS
jgi:hypothetical protein